MSRRTTSVMRLLPLNWQYKANGEAARFAQDETWLARDLRDFRPRERADHLVILRQQIRSSL